MAEPQPEPSPPPTPRPPVLATSPGPQANLVGDTIFIDMMTHVSDIGEPPGTFTAGNLPPNAAIDPVTGVIAGTAMELWTKQAAVQIANASGSSLKRFSWNVTEPPVPEPEPPPVAAALTNVLYIHPVSQECVLIPSNRHAGHEKLITRLVEKGFWAFEVAYDQVAENPVLVAMFPYDEVYQQHLEAVKLDREPPPPPPIGAVPPFEEGGRRVVMRRKPTPLPPGIVPLVGAQMKPPEPQG
jgi:hypothetical protein